MPHGRQGLDWRIIIKWILKKQGRVGDIGLKGLEDRILQQLLLTREVIIFSVL
jgi:hypothetical protein